MILITTLESMQCYKYYHPIITEGLEIKKSQINKLGLKDIPDIDRSVQISYANFFNTHKYIPTETDPPHVSEKELLESMEEIQKNYAKR